MRKPITFFTFHEKNVFMPLRSVYPECFALIERNDQLYPLQCFAKECPANKNCAEVLAKRINYLFTCVFPKAKLLVLYYKYRDKPNSIRGGVFNRDLDEPYLLDPMNLSAFHKFRKEGIVYQWVPTDDFLFMGGDGKLIPVESLIK